MMTRKRISSWLEPGKQVDDWVDVSLADDSWVRKTPDWKVGDPRSYNDHSLQVAPGKHTLRIAFVFEDGVRPVSQPVEIEVGKESAWGEAVNGVQARVRTAKTVWKADETPTFHLDLRNQGTMTWNARRVPYDCQIEVDGTWYSFDKPSGPYPAVGDLLEPGKQIDDWATVSPDKNWGSSAGKMLHFPLAPGKHTVRVTYPLNGKTKSANRAVSGPVEIEIQEK